MPRPARRPPRGSLARPRPLACWELRATLLLAALAATAGAATAADRAIVVLNNGSRIEVTRAWQEGGEYRLLLPTGGTVTLPATQVRRVSHDASDLAPGRPGIAILAAGPPLPATASGAPIEAGATVSAAGRDPATDVRRSIPVDPEALRPLSVPSPDTFATIAPPPLVGGGPTARAGVQPTSATTTEQRPRQREDLALRPGQLGRVIKRLDSRGARPVSAAQDR